MPADGECGGRSLVDRAPGTSDADPAFSPDGSKIAFRRVRTPTGPTAQIIMVNTDGSGTPYRSPTGPGRSGSDLVPDGTQIAFKSNRTNAAGTNDNQIWVINADGTGLKELGVGSPGVGRRGSGLGSPLTTNDCPEPLQVVQSSSRMVALA